MNRNQQQEANRQQWHRDYQVARELRSKGWTYRAIAELLKCSVPRVRNMFPQPRENGRD